MAAAPLPAEGLAGATTDSSNGNALLQPPKNLPRLILLDRDGVINEDVGSPGVLSPSQLRLTPGAANAIGNLRRAGCTVVLVTNQSCVGKGLITGEDLKQIHDKLGRMLRSDDDDAILDRIYSCTSTKESGDSRMKPGGGMILEACKDFSVDASCDDCALVGDSVTDLMAAEAGAVKVRILVATGYGLSVMSGRMPMRGSELVSASPDTDSVPPSVFPFVYVANLAEAASWLLSGRLVS